MSPDTLVPARPAARGRGLPLVVLMVAVGLGASSVLYRQIASDIAVDAAAARGELPQSPEGRLDRWIEHVEPGMYGFLEQLRLSAERPWIVTHTVGAQGQDDDLEIWGVDFSAVPKRFVHREGLELVVELPAPRLLGTGPLSGDRVRNVPRVAPGAVFDAEARERQLVDWALRRFVTGLTRDIEGTKFVIRIGSAPPAEIPSGG